MRNKFDNKDGERGGYGHPDYRSIAQEMWRKIESVHPALAECAKFIDWKSYRLGRLQSEIRSEYKKSAFE